jgi:hypothetical protein
VLAVAGGLLLLGAGCGGTDDGGATDDSTPAAGEAGDLLVTLDGEDQELVLTSCASDEERLTFQGADGDGATAVGVLAADGSSGSLTVSDASGAWVTGTAVDEPFDELEVDDGAASGSGTFAVQEYGEVEDDNRPVEDTGETVDGSFEVTCER